MRIHSYHKGELEKETITALENMGFENTSWHNDMSASYSKNWDSDGDLFRLWVSDQTPDSEEMNMELSNFLFVHEDESQDVLHDAHFETEKEALSYIQGYLSAKGLI